MQAICESIRPLIFAALERQIDRGERVRLNAHLATCDECCSFERAERALTELLDCDAPATPHKRIARLAAPVAIAGAIALLLLILPAATPRGSIIERQLGTSLSWVETESELATSNHLSIPRSGSVAITPRHRPAKPWPNSSARPFRIIPPRATIPRLVRIDPSGMVATRMPMRTAPPP